jgi:hypothetical protein
MIPKFYLCTVVSCVKAPLIELCFISFKHAITLVWWMENLISLGNNFNDMPPLD